jgi:hypothetical protein
MTRFTRARGIKVCKKFRDNLCSKQLPKQFKTAGIVRNIFESEFQYALSKRISQNKRELKGNCLSELIKCAETYNILRNYLSSFSWPGCTYEQFSLLKKLAWPAFEQDSLSRKNFQIFTVQEQIKHVKENLFVCAGLYRLVISAFSFIVFIIHTLANDSLPDRSTQCRKLRLGVAPTRQRTLVEICLPKILILIQLQLVFSCIWVNVWMRPILSNKVWNRFKLLELQSSWSFLSPWSFSHRQEFN